MVVVAVIAILAMVAVKVYNSFFKSAFEVDPVAALLTARMLQEDYYTEHDEYACNIEDLPEFNDGTKDNKYYLSSSSDPRRRFYITVKSCSDTSYTLSVKNETTDSEWEVEWELSCGTTSTFAQCRPQQVKGSGVFKDLF